MNNPLSPEESAAIFDQLTAELSAIAPAAAPLAVSFDAPEPESEPEPTHEPVPSNDPQPFAFGQERSQPSQRLAGLERLNERMARAIRPAIEPIARARVTVSPEPLEILPYEQWADAQPDFSTLTLYRLRPLKGGMLVQIDPHFLASLVEIFYGGAPTAQRKRKPGDLTASEELLLNRLLERLSAILTSHWSELVPVELAYGIRETNVAHLPFLRGEDMAVVQNFKLTGLVQPTTISVVYPLAMLRPIEEKLAMRGKDEGAAAGEDWRRRMSQALEQVSLPVRSVLARPEISVAELLALKVGDVIPITLPPRTPLLAGARRIADGVIGEQDGRAALMIEKVGNA